MEIDREALSDGAGAQAEYGEVWLDRDGDAVFITRGRVVMVGGGGDGDYRLVSRVDPPTDASADPVNHPAHYIAGGFEVTDIIDAFGLGFELGNVTKYVLRAGRKDPETRTQDLEKAAWYLAREISNAEKGQGNDK